MFYQSCISSLQEVFPLRFKALHFVNEPSIFDWVFSLIKPFLSETIKGRVSTIQYYHKLHHLFYTLIQ